MATSPSNSPLYALADRVFSGNDHTSLPRPLEHSNINAADQMSGCNSLMYNPSVTAKHELSAIASCIHFSFPTRRKEFHIQVHPHSINTSINSVGGVSRLKRAENEEIANTATATSLTVQNPPTFSFGWFILERFQRLGVRL